MAEDFGGRRARDRYTVDMFGAPVPETQGERHGLPGQERRDWSNSQRREIDRAGTGGDRLLRDDATGLFSTRTHAIEVGTRTIGATRVTNPQEAAQALAYLARGAVEHFDALVTDKDGKPLAVIGNYKGKVDQTSVYPTVLVAEAFRIHGAASVWGAHNHPSGTVDFSHSDRMLSRDIHNLFKGSGIAYQGLFAIAGRSQNDKRAWVFDSQGDGNPQANDEFGWAEPDSNTMAVPTIDREYSEEGRLGPVIDSPNAAQEAARRLSAGQSGVLLNTTRNEPLAFIPVSPAMAGELRKDGRMDALYRALSVANPGSSIIVNNGDFSDQQVENLAGLLNSMDTKVLDVVDATGQGLPWSMQGKIFGGVDFRSVEQGVPNPSTIDEVRADAVRLLGGRAVKSLEEKTLLRFHEKAHPKSIFAKTQGIFDGKAIHLIAGNIERGNGGAVLSHEGFHLLLQATEFGNSEAHQRFMRQLERIDSKYYRAEVDSAGEIVETITSPEDEKLDEFYRRALARMPKEDRTDPTRRLQELGAYAIEEYIRAPRSLPEKIRRSVEELITSAWLWIEEKLHITREHFTEAELAIITRNFLRDQASGGGAPQTFTGGSTWAKSVASQDFVPERFNEISQKFQARIESVFRRLESGKRVRESVLIHGHAPAAFRLLGWQDRWLTIQPKELVKIANKSEFAGLTDSETARNIASIVKDLGRPAAMFWNTDNNSLNILRRDKMVGVPALIAVQPDANEGGHLVVTAHALASPSGHDQILQKIRQGTLLPIYVDTASAPNVLSRDAYAEFLRNKWKYPTDKTMRLAHELRHASVGLKRLGSGDKLPDQYALVNWEREQWGDRPLFSRVTELLQHKWKYPTDESIKRLAHEPRHASVELKRLGTADKLPDQYAPVNFEHEQRGDRPLFSQVNEGLDTPDRFRVIADAFARRAATVLDALAAGRQVFGPVVIHENAPAAFRLLGWQDRRVVINPKELLKLADKHEFQTDGNSNEDIARQISGIVTDLGRPAAMFWNTKNDSLNVLRREQMSGAPAMVAVRSDTEIKDRSKAHLVVTAYAAGSNAAIAKQIDSGVLVPLYLEVQTARSVLGRDAFQSVVKNKKKYQAVKSVRPGDRSLAPELLRARAGLEQLGMTGNLPDQHTLVKWEREQWGDRPLFSVAPSEVVQQTVAVTPLADCVPEITLHPATNRSYTGPILSIDKKHIMQATPEGLVQHARISINGGKDLKPGASITIHYPYENVGFVRGPEMGHQGREVKSPADGRHV
jgi:hypothetical protein